MSQLPEDPMSQAEIDEIKALYREAAGEQSTAAHDAAVLAAMQAELAAARRAKASPLRKWQLPVALAATVVLTFALTLTVQHEQPDEVYAPMRRAPPVAPGSGAPASEMKQLEQQRAPVPASENAQGTARRKTEEGQPAASAVEKLEMQGTAPAPNMVAPDAAKDEAAAPAVSPNFSVPAPPAQNPESVNDSRARSVLRPSGVSRDGADTSQPGLGAGVGGILPPSRLDASPPVILREPVEAAKPAAPVAPAGSKARKEAPFESAIPPSQPQVASPPPPPPAPKPMPETRAIAPSPPVASEPQPLALPEAFPRPAEPSRPASVAAPARPPHEWLDAIRAMKQAGLREDAEEELRKFRLAYPDYPVPADLSQATKP
jgi:hypothetical protein